MKVLVEPVASEAGSWTGAYPEIGIGISADGSDDTPGSPGYAEITSLACADQVIGDPVFTNPDGSVTLDVMYEDSSDNWDLAFTSSYTFSGGQATGYDPVLMQKQILDPTTGDPVSNRRQHLRQPLDSTSDASSVQLGTGHTDEWGFVIADLTPDSLGALVGNSTYATDNGVIDISVQYTDDYNMTHEALNMPYFIGTGNQPDPILNQLTLEDSDGNPLPDGVALLVRAVPVDIESYGNLEYPIVGTATVLQGNVVGTLDLEGVQGNPDFVAPGDDNLSLQVGMSQIGSDPRLPVKQLSTFICSLVRVHRDRRHADRLQHHCGTGHAVGQRRARHRSAVSAGEHGLPSGEPAGLRRFIEFVRRLHRVRLHGTMRRERWLWLPLELAHGRCPR